MCLRDGHGALNDVTKVVIVVGVILVFWQIRLACLLVLIVILIFSLILMQLKGLHALCTYDVIDLRTCGGVSWRSPWRRRCPRRPKDQKGYHGYPKMAK